MLFRVIRITMAMTLLLSAMTSWVCAAPLSGASGLPCPESEHSVTWTSSLNTQTCSMSPCRGHKGQLYLLSDISSIRIARTKQVQSKIGAPLSSDIHPYSFTPVRFGAAPLDLPLADAPPHFVTNCSWLC